MGVGLSSSLHFVVIFANSKTGIVSFVCGIQFKGARKKERHHMETTIGFCATNYMEMCGLHQSSNLSYAAGPKDASRNLIQNKKCQLLPGSEPPQTFAVCTACNLLHTVLPIQVANSLSLLGRARTPKTAKRRSILSPILLACSGSFRRKSRRNGREAIYCIMIAFPSKFFVENHC